MAKAPKLSYENIGRVLECIQIVRGTQKFKTWDYFELVYAAVYPDDAERLRKEERMGGHSLRQTIAGRLFDYFKHWKAKYGPRINRLSPVPKSNAEYEIVG